MSRTKKDRKQKIKKREERQFRQERKKRDLFNNALQHVGLKEAFMRLDPSIRPLLRKWAYSEPVVTIGPSMADCSEAEDLRRRFLEILRAPSSYPGQSVTPAEWMSIVRSLFWSLDAVGREKQAGRFSADWEKDVWPGVQSLMEGLRQLVTQLDVKIQAWLTVEFSMEVLTRSQLDEKILWYDIGYSQGSKKKNPTPYVTLHKSVPAWTTIEVDGKPRRAFRCLLFAVPTRPEEIAWPRSELGVQFGPDRFPVYVQRHALEQVKRRLPEATPISITCSLSQPAFFNVDHGRFLVELRTGKSMRLGYFVGQVIGDKVLLKTFLFLTMQGTPEAKLLYKNLRLTRRDINYTHLDEISFFADPELAKDTELRHILDRCGCGHLLDLDFDESFDELPAGNAEILRQYLSDGSGLI